MNKVHILEYEIMIYEASHLTFNIKEDKIYKKCGGNLIGGLVVKTEDLDENYPNPIKKGDEFLNLYFSQMLDSAICFSDKDIKLFLKKYDIKLEHTHEHLYIDQRQKTKAKLLKKFIGIKLLVEEIKIIDYREDDGNPDYDTENDLFNLEFYEPDDWEFVLKVKKVL